MPDASGNLTEEEKEQLGLINIPATPTMQTATYTPAQATADLATSGGYTPQPYAVTPEQTVQEQVKQIVAKDSPLLRQAEQRALQRMNARGLLNSSIAVGAGQEAVVGAALPIASADAAAYERAAINTANQINAARAFESAASNEAARLNAQLGTNVNLQNVGMINAQRQQMSDALLKRQLAQLEADTRLSVTDKQIKSAELISQGDNLTKRILMDMQNRTDLTRTILTVDNQLAIARIDQDTKRFLGQLDANNKQLLQTSASAAQMFQQVVDAIGRIAVSGLDAGAKANATQTQLNALNEGLKMLAAVASTEQEAVRNLDLSQYFIGTLSGGGPSGPAWTAPAPAAWTAPAPAASPPPGSRQVIGPGGSIINVPDDWVFNFRAGGYIRPGALATGGAGGTGYGSLFFMNEDIIHVPQDQAPA